MICKYIPSSCGCFFTLLTLYFNIQILKIFMKWNVSILPLVTCAFHVICKKLLLNTMFLSFSSMFSSENFTALGVTFRSLSHLELTFTYSVRKGSNLIILHVEIQFSSLHLLKNYPLLVGWSWHPCQKSFDYICRGLFLGCLCYSIGLYVCLYANTTLIWLLQLCSKFWNQEMLSPPLLFSFKIVLAIWVSLRFQMNIRMKFSIYANNIIKILIRIVFGL